MFKSIVAGRITKDLELKEVSESIVCNFTVAADNYIGNTKEVNFIRCSLWGARAEALYKQAKKGQQVFLIGKASMKSFPGNDGVERTVLNVSVEEIELGRKSSKTEEIRTVEKETSEEPIII